MDLLFFYAERNMLAVDVPLLCISFRFACHYGVRKRIRRDVRTVGGKDSAMRALPA